MQTCGIRNGARGHELALKLSMGVYEGRPTNSWTFCTVLKPYDLSNSTVHRFFMYYFRINVENLTPIAQ